MSVDYVRGNRGELLVWARGNYDTLNGNSGRRVNRGWRKEKRNSKVEVIALAPSCSYARTTNEMRLGWGRGMAFECCGTRKCVPANIQYNTIAWIQASCGTTYKDRATQVIPTFHCSSDAQFRCQFHQRPRKLLRGATHITAIDEIDESIPNTPFTILNCQYCQLNHH